MTTRILVGFDRTPEARSAARFAAQLAYAQRARLLLVNVIPEPWPNSPLSEQNAARQAINEEERSTAESALRAEAAELVGAETRVAQGKPAQALAAVAGERDVALVVVGHRDRGALARALGGSVAIRLVQICSKPVLVFRRCDPPPTPACTPRGAVVHPLRR
jgi:nucleotide-binding universal stress UspA family protein